MTCSLGNIQRNALHLGDCRLRDGAEALLVIEQRFVELHADARDAIGGVFAASRAATNATVGGARGQLRGTLRKSAMFSLFERSSQCENLLHG